MGSMGSGLFAFLTLLLHENRGASRIRLLCYEIGDVPVLDAYSSLGINILLDMNIRSMLDFFYRMQRECQQHMFPSPSHPGLATIATQGGATAGVRYWLENEVTINVV